MMEGQINATLLQVSHAVTAIESGHRFCEGSAERRVAGLRNSPGLSPGFDLLYKQKFAEACQIFASWEFRNQEDPFGDVAMAASYLFENCTSKAY